MSVHEFGSLAWGEETAGLLTGAQQWRLGLLALRDGATVLRSRLLLALGARRGGAEADLSTLQTPDSPLARAVERVAEQQKPAMLGHVRRTVVFAHAVAAHDNIRVDAELLWCACLLHDIALEAPETDRCFAVRGGLMARDIALKAGADRATAELLGDTICRHPTPRLNRKRFPLPYLVASGALVDVLGRRLEQLDPGFVSALLAAEPRAGFADAVATGWKLEARAVPAGRAAVAEHLGFSQLARQTPLSDTRL
jgi:HD domain